jgi:probable HAF family extracellular repeat protein
MKSIVTSIIAVAAAVYAQSSSPSIAGDQSRTRYIVKDLGPFPGGTFSYAAFITNNGLVAGRANGKTGHSDGAWHTVLWPQGATTPIDISTPGLGGQNSEAFGVNERGQVSGEAETDQKDPKGEDFCGFGPIGLPGAGNTCLGFRWQNGVMTRLLPLIGKDGVRGNNSSGSQINNRGEVAGIAENSTLDPDCQAPQNQPSSQLYQFKPVVWDAAGNVHELPTGNNDPDGVAFSLNDNGQVVGGSGTCIAFDTEVQTYLNPVHALLWQNGEVHDLGSLPGQVGSIAAAINNRGQVVGSSGIYGFLWTQATGMQPLYPLPGDFLSAPFIPSDSGDVVVGLSLDGTFTALTAVLWENGANVPVNLNELVIDNAGLYLQIAEDINSRGEIVGFAQTSAGDTHGYLAIPIKGAAAGESFSLAARSVTRPVALSENARKLLQRRMRFGRLGARLAGSR